jgi:hypothetical protein
MSPSGIRKLSGIVLLVAVQGLAGCGRSAPSSPSAPSPAPQPVTQLTPTLVVFSEKASGFSTSDVRDVQEQILQFTAGELIWTADGTRLSGYPVYGHDFSDGPRFFITGPICPQGCEFEVRFGTKDGERRAYLTVDYGHYNPGTVVDVEVVAGALVVTQTSVFPPGTPTLSGMITELTPAGPIPVEGVKVYRSMTTGWQDTTTDKNGFYRMFGMFDGTGAVSVIKEGFQTERRDVLINGDTRFDIALVRQ